MVGVSTHLSQTTLHCQTIEVTIVNGKVLIPILVENKLSLLKMEIPGLPDLAKHNSCNAWLKLRVLEDGELFTIRVSRVEQLLIPAIITARQPGSPQRVHVEDALHGAPRKQKCDMAQVNQEDLDAQILFG